jgi:hypothetical protein
MHAEGLTKNNLRNHYQSVLNNSDSEHCPLILINRNFSKPALEIFILLSMFISANLELGFQVVQGILRRTNDNDVQDGRL